MVKTGVSMNILSNAFEVLNYKGGYTNKKCKNHYHVTISMQAALVPAIERLSEAIQGEKLTRNIPTFKNSVLRITEHGLAMDILEEKNTFVMVFSVATSNGN